MGDHLRQRSDLIVSDDTEFARSVAARWQAERHVPEITLVTSDVWNASSAAGYDVVIVGPVHDGKASAILSALSSYPATSAVLVCEDEKDISWLQEDYPHVQVVPRRDGGASTLILISSEALRRVEAVVRAQRAERLAIESQGHATLGLYMLD